MGKISDFFDRLRGRKACPVWRVRLREAVDRTGKKHSYVAELAGINHCTLSRILTGTMKKPSFQSVVNIAHAALRVHRAT